MAVKRCEASIDVVQAARIRIRNVFGNGLPVYMSFSVGKGNRVTSLLFITAYLRFSLTIQHFVMMCYSTNKTSNLM